MTLAEKLEEVGQDAARFRWCLTHHKEASAIFSRVSNGGHRFDIDRLRLEPPNWLLDAPGGRYDGE